MSKIVSVGRRKRSTARIFLSPGAGSFLVNKREFQEYFPIDFLQMKILEPFAVANENQGAYDIKVNVHGGGITGQAEAVRLGIARALIETQTENRPPLKRAGLLTRDSRKVERKKAGLRKARKSSQFSKR